MDRIGRVDQKNKPIDRTWLNKMGACASCQLTTQIDLYFSQHDCLCRRFPIGGKNVRFSPLSFVVREIHESSFLVSHTSNFS